MAREQLQAADALRGIGATRWPILALAHLVGTIDDPDQAQRIYRETSFAEESGDVRGAAIVKGNYAGARPHAGG